MRGVVDQFAPIDKRNDLYPFGKKAIIQFPHLCFNADEHWVRVLSLLQQQDAFYDIRDVDKLPILTTDGSAVLPQPDLRTLLDGRDVLYAQGRSGLRLDDGVFNVLYVGHESYGLHIDLLRSRNDIAASSVGVIVGQLLLNLSDAQTVGDELVWVEAD